MIDIKLTRGLVVVLSCVLVLAVLLTSLTLTGDNASASDIEAAQAASTGMRQFYLSLVSVDGSDALSACAEGYHMASLWEIVDPSNLAYNTALGSTKPDSGQGPPSSEQGWVRTGYASSDSISPGIGNCDTWTSSGSSGSGSVAYLPQQWDASAGEVSVWLVTSSDCTYGQRVWCIED